MLWLYLTLFAYFFDAIAFIIDKYLIASRITDPAVYAFGISVLSAGVIFLIPFGVSLPGFLYFFIALISGVTFYIGVLFIYKSVKISDISVVSTNIGAMSAIFSYIFSSLILKERLSNIHFLAFLFLVVGILFLGRVEKRIFKYAITSGLFFGLSLVLLKWNFDHSSFINGIFWTRIGFVIAGLSSLLNENVRNKIKNSFKEVSHSTKSLFVFNKALAAIGFIAIYYAIRLGSVSLVNALLGFQFIFVFLLALFFKNKISNIGENLERPVLINKILGIILVSIGFFALVFT